MRMIAVYFVACVNGRMYKAAPRCDAGSLYLVTVVAMGDRLSELTVRHGWLRSLRLFAKTMSELSCRYTLVAGHGDWCEG